MVVSRIDASRATEGETGWMLHQVELTGFTTPGAAPLKRERIGWRTALQPGDVQSFFEAGPQITVGAARRAIDFVAPVDRGTSYFKTRVLRALAEPLAPFVMLLLALPLAFVGGRTSAAWPAVLYAVFGGLSYLVIDGVLTVMAQVGGLPPMVGAWTAPILGCLIACWVLLLLER
jgi:lipopolysaccharide export LptBFGC system permease protein LptF